MKETRAKVVRVFSFFFKTQPGVQKHKSKQLEFWPECRKEMDWRILNKQSTLVYLASSVQATRL